MRTNIEIDDDLLAEATRIAGTKTKRATVEHALRELVRRAQQLKVLELRGIGWEGEVEELRYDRFPNLVLEADPDALRLLQEYGPIRDDEDEA